MQVTRLRSWSTLWMCSRQTLGAQLLQGQAVAALNALHASALALRST